MFVAKRKTSNIYHRMHCRYVENFCEDIFDYYDQEEKKVKEVLQPGKEKRA